MPIQVLAYKDANGLVILHLDLSAVPLGTLTTGIATGISYSITATATDAWGGVSPASTPFICTKPNGPPTAPASLFLSLQ